MLNFLIPTNIFQLISNLGIFALVALTLFMFRKIKIGKEGIEVEKDSEGNKITLITIYDKITAIEENDRTQNLDIQNIKYYLEKQPPELKLISGLRYLKGGGNGKMMNDVCKYIEEHKDIYKTIIALEPDLEIKSFTGETLKS